ncbi:DUF3010 family protein [Veronia pacifica]|uniref:DUF3010 domain-containing protein n=1 Tax=Veronia pacifica TaxID=1080227 RepID=A0A1C3EMU4_9GAMM|nr:DUF3010 family protein [Veronia pacifica]ODA34551.1 hypothetical protein A8L45_06165 [Veronia pacifica]
MRICAVDLKSNEANICLLELNQGMFEVPECRTRKMTIADASNAEEMRHFQRTFAKLMEDYKVEKIVVRERPMKGKFAGSAIGFKIEAALQLLDNIDCEILTAADMKQSLKRSPVDVSMKEVGLKQFQEQAFMTACAYLNQ